MHRNFAWINFAWIAKGINCKRTRWDSIPDINIKYWMMSTWVKNCNLKTHAHESLSKHVVFSTVMTGLVVTVTMMTIVRTCDSGGRVVTTMRIVKRNCKWARDKQCGNVVSHKRTAWNEQQTERRDLSTIQRLQSTEQIFSGKLSTKSTFRRAPLKTGSPPPSLPM